MPGLLDPKKVKGKILLCTWTGYIEQGYEALRLGAVGMISANKEEFGNYISGFPPQPLPTASVDYFDGLTIKDYINSTK